MGMILAPLRGVTIRCFRETFAEEIRAAGFTEAFTPFIAAMPGVDPLRDRELRGASAASCGILLTPQFIGKDPQALRRCLERTKDAGFATADLNCGCPFPMVRKKGRGSGLLETPGVLARMLEAGCETLGPGRFSVKARLGTDDPGTLLSLMPLLNSFPLRFLTVHGRIARQMYSGECDMEVVRRVEEAAEMPVVRNGDLDWRGGTGMVGRSFVRSLGGRGDSRELLLRYAEASKAEIGGGRALLGRIKELVSYWSVLPGWRRVWRELKLCATFSEVESVLNSVA